jgi:hypothetical protein
MIKKLRRRTTLENVTIDRFNAAGTPSLAAYWPCSDGSGTTVRDYSQYGHHLTWQQGTVGGNLSNPWSYKNGYLSLIHGDKATVSGITDSLLDSQDRIVVVSGSFQSGNVLSDADMGTAWEVALEDGSGNPDYLGFSVSTGADVMVFRISTPDETPGVGFATERTDAGSGSITTGTPHGVAGVFVPGDSVRCSIDGGSIISTATLYTSVPSVNVFGLCSTRASGFIGSVAPSSVAHYQVWVFDAEPPRLNEALQLMSLHPGVLPRWWEGR